MTLKNHGAALRAIARRAMIQYGLEPDWPPEADAELTRMRQPPRDGLRDLRQLSWSYRRGLTKGLGTFVFRVDRPSSPPLTESDKAM